MNDKHNVIYGYGQWAKELFLQSRETYFVNFMFREMNGTSRTMIDRMKQEVDKLYGHALTHFSRRPTKHPEQLPRFFGMPDLPVPKQGKAQVSHLVNGGFHFNGLLFVPDQCRSKFGQVVGVFRDIAAKVHSMIERLDFTPVTHDPEKVADYALKLAKRKPEMVDHILILPGF